MNYTLGDKRLLKGTKNGPYETSTTALILLFLYFITDPVIRHLGVGDIVKCYLTIAVLGIIALAYLFLVIRKIQRNKEVDLILVLFVLLMLVAIAFQIQTITEYGNIVPLPR